MGGNCRGNGCTGASEFVKQGNEQAFSIEKKFKNTEKCDILKLCHKIGFEEYFGNDKEDNRFT